MRSRPRRDRDTAELVEAVRRQISAIEQRADSEDPWVAAELEDIRRELAGTVDRIVRGLRRRGYPWQDIAYQFGISKQGAWNRWHE